MNGIALVTEVESETVKKFIDVFNAFHCGYSLEYRQLTEAEQAPYVSDDSVPTFGVAYDATGEVESARYSEIRNYWHFYVRGNMEGFAEGSASAR